MKFSISVITTLLVVIKLLNLRETTWILRFNKYNMDLHINRLRTKLSNYRTAFSFWILANIMICSVIFYGGALFTLTGVTMVLTSIVYHCLQPTAPLRFFCSESEFHLHYGICFWSVLLMGTLILSSYNNGCICIVHRNM